MEEKPDLNTKNKRKVNVVNEQRKKQRTDFKNLIEDVKYTFKDGKRYVEPYVYHHETFCKQRWLGKTLLDVYSSEFAAYSRDYYEEAINAGRITVNGEAVRPDYILKNSDLIRHSVHRHEPPVIDEPIQILKETDDVLCVSKPASLPVHPCGTYRHNTMEFIMKTELNIQNVYFIHRLDRVTSGLLLTAKSKEKAGELSQLLRGRTAHKVYLCITDGIVFPTGIKIDAPIDVVSHKKGLYACDSHGKPSCTYCVPLYYIYNKNQICDIITIDSIKDNEDIYTLLLCIPVTGRTHQIRLHTKYIGHPIYNDVHYNEKCIRELKEMVPWSPAVIPKDIQNYPLEERIKLTCRFCQMDEKERMNALYNDEQLSFMSIALHAFIYIMNGERYECSLPTWPEINTIPKEQLLEKIKNSINIIFNYDQEHPFLNTDEENNEQ
ncbi:hypothetical protein WA158_000805 [Blastocystis sp. Blastoise]